ncbi:ATP-binding protein [Nitrospira sp. NS4]|uniref:sensor histidine kinase n=1 Tax=Nitrospira sp. NS4 TaxID=3414498 RepID=UPI003C2C3BE2
MNAQVKQWAVSSGVAALTAGLLVVDLHTPLGVANHILYLAPVLLSLLSPQQWFPFIVSGTVTVLIVVAGLLSENPHNVPLWVPISNRAFSIWAMWVPVWYFTQRRNHERLLQRLNDELEQRVKERTQQLADVNDALVTEVTERMQTERSLESSRQELKRLASQLIRIQEEERRRISRDLHDDINQRLALVAIELERLEQHLPALHTEAVRSLSNRVGELSEDVRHLAYQYHPSILDDLGLSIAMQRLVEDVAARSQIEAHIDCDQLPERLSLDVATCIYRVAQESLVNIIRHAKASRVEVELGRSSRGLTLSIADNGVGFHADPPHSDTGGLGFLSMKERVSLVGGILRIESAIGTGTRVQAMIPLAETNI